MRPDHYRVLGVDPGADPEQIRAAYLRVMRACHPDVRPGDLAAAEAARQANLAWAVLQDPHRRAAYDRQLRAAGVLRSDAAARDGADWRDEPSQAAYEQRRKAYGQTFHRAIIRVAAAVFASGLLLLALTAR